MTVVVAAAVAVVVAGAVLAPVRTRPTPSADEARPTAAPGSVAGPAAPRVRPTSRFGAALGRVVVRRRAGRTVGAEQTAAWCEALARRVRSGSSLRQAVEAVEPVTPALGRRLAPVRHRVTRGGTLAAAVAVGAPDDPDLHLALDMIGVTAALGGSPAEALDRTATTLRQRAADRADRRTQAAQARISAHVLTVVPLGVLALLLLSDDGVRAAAVSPGGAACIGGGLVLNGLGWVWMRAVIGGSG